MSAYLPLSLQRNGSIGRTLTFTDPAGDPLDLTGATFAMRVKYAAGAGAVLATANIVITDAEAGEIRFVLLGGAFGAVPGPMEPVELAYDLIATQDGVPVDLLRGPLILLPGVS